MATSVQAPPRQPRIGGLSAVIDGYIDEPRLAVLQGGLAWEDVDCGAALSETKAGCYDTVTAAVDKDGEGIAQFTSIVDPFARYSGVQCFIGGDNDGESYRARAERKLEGLQDRAVEAVLWDWVTGATTGVFRGTLVERIAAAEEYADKNYEGRPILVLSRAAALLAFAAGALVWLDGKLVTGNHTPVLATGEVPDAEEGNVGIIGGLAVYASSVVSRTGIDHRSNVELAIAERLYTLGVDCDFRHYVTNPPD